MALRKWSRDTCCRPARTWWVPVQANVPSRPILSNHLGRSTAAGFGMTVRGAVQRFLDARVTHHQPSLLGIRIVIGHRASHTVYAPARFCIVYRATGVVQAPTRCRTARRTIS